MRNYLNEIKTASKLHLSFSPRSPSEAFDAGSQAEPSPIPHHPTGWLLRIKYNLSADSPGGAGSVKLLELAGRKFNRKPSEIVQNNRK
ncbi:hypothetical protein GCM10023188_27340 [Pontibacter saemangeumensis]|uniref:Uncharacterized protein n=1 Tax=Pontibacter saemangeumensis TaxID=1084525 RepID=A0ABP8LV87_9BACT